RLPLLSIAGGVQSWIVLAAGCDSAAAVVGLLPSLLVLIGLTLVMLAGYTWAHIDARRRGGAAGGSEIAFRHGAFLGLAGHLFLFYIAANPEWSTPPWPLLGSLALLTLAASATSLAAETPPLHAAGALAAAIVVLAWTENGMPGEWATTALVAAEAAAVYALAWLPVARRIHRSWTAAAIGAAGVLFVSELTLVDVSIASGAPALGVLIAAHAANLCLILALAW